MLSLKCEISCITCGVGICLVKDVVSIHALGDQIKSRIERELTDYLNNQKATPGEYS